jgi:hypothetical protein
MEKRENKKNNNSTEEGKGKRLLIVSGSKCRSQRKSPFPSVVTLNSSLGHRTCISGLIRYKQSSSVY